MKQFSEISDMLSGLDIIEWFSNLDYQIPLIITYPELTSMSNILTKNNGYCCFLLYEKEPRIGHWTLVFIDPVDKMIEFFDPYGVEIDDQLNHTFYKDKQRILTKKFLDMRDDIFEINDIQFQKFANNVNTCGKWCCIRYWASQVGISKKDFDKSFSFDLVNDDKDIIMNDLFNDLS